MVNGSGIAYDGGNQKRRWRGAEYRRSCSVRFCACCLVTNTDDVVRRRGYTWAATAELVDRVATTLRHQRYHGDSCKWLAAGTWQITSEQNAWERRRHGGLCRADNIMQPVIHRLVGAAKWFTGSDDDAQ